MLIIDRVRLFFFLMASMICFVLGRLLIEPFRFFRRLWGRGKSSSLRFKHYKASGDEARPLLVLLHGCAQSANGIIRASQFKREAKKAHFHLLVPKQSWGQNPLNCWNWFLPQNQQTHSAESELKRILECIESYCQRYKVDRKRICVAGLSSGAATAAGLIHEAPQVFSGALLHSGPAFGSAQGPLAAPRVIKEGVSLPTSLPVTRYFGRLICIRGDQDQVVHPSHQELLLHQFTTSEERHMMWSEENSQESSSKKYDVQYFGLEKESPRVLAVTVHGMGHAWSGGSRLVFSDPEGPRISSWAVEFFGLNL